LGQMCNSTLDIINKHSPHVKEPI